jgi:hypothetical protein
MILFRELTSIWTTLKKWRETSSATGRWSAPYWFIDLEQGGGDDDRRAEAFMRKIRKDQDKRK